MRALLTTILVLLLAGCSSNVRSSDGRVLDASDSRWLEQRLAAEIAERGPIVQAHSWASPQVLVRLDGEVVVISPVQAAITEALLSQGAIVHAEPMSEDGRIVVTLTAMPGPESGSLRQTTYLAVAEMRSATGTVLDMIRLQVDKRWQPQPKWK
jgi:hypothetical protein